MALPLQAEHEWTVVNSGLERAAAHSLFRCPVLASSGGQRLLTAAGARRCLPCRKQRFCWRRSTREALRSWNNWAEFDIVLGAAACVTWSCLQQRGHFLPWQTWRRQLWVLFLWRAESKRFLFQAVKLNLNGAVWSVVGQKDPPFSCWSLKLTLKLTCSNRKNKSVVNVLSD